MDLIFHVDRVHNILQEICTGGMVLETNMSEILTHVEAQNRLEKSEATAVTTLKVGAHMHSSNLLLIHTGWVLYSSAIQSRMCHNHPILAANSAISVHV